MNVVVYGANGMLGPHVVKSLESDHTLLLTDINDLEDSPLEGTTHEYRKVDASDFDAVVAAAEGMDAIVNLSVLRHDRQIAFDVNARGCYNVMTAAVEHGIRRVVNTGPHFTIAGPSYERFDYQIGTDMPPQSGTNLYAHTKSLGQEICRVFTENHDVYVLTLLFYNFRFPDDHAGEGQDFTPFTVTWCDAGEAFRPALDIELEALPSRCEIFNIFADLPHNRFSNEKTKRILGWKPTDNLERFWRKSS
ncbi:MAG: NAD(P)-dependent oxidoreductase [bacterium]|nr:NAD(P)-dependent oxidoreductase [bacterium]